MRDATGRLWFLSGLVPNGRETICGVILLAVIALIVVAIMRGLLKQWME